MNQLWKKEKVEIFFQKCSKKDKTEKRIKTIRIKGTQNKIKKSRMKRYSKREERLKEGQKMVSFTTFLFIFVDTTFCLIQVFSVSLPFFSKFTYFARIFENKW